MKKMGHQIIGYPSLAVNREILLLMRDYGIDFFELQLPCSEPAADGPLFLKANQAALKQGMTTKAALEFIEEMVKELGKPIYLMAYYNQILAKGIAPLLSCLKTMGVKGLIVPDAPYDQAKDLWAACEKFGLENVPIITSKTAPDRSLAICKSGAGFVYYVPRTGVTGNLTDIDVDVIEGINNLKQLTALPIGVGFGIQSQKQIAALEGTADLVIMGSVFLQACP